MNLLIAERDLRWMQWQRWEAKCKAWEPGSVERSICESNAQQAAKAYLAAARAAQDAALHPAWHADLAKAELLVLAQQAKL